MMLLGTTRPVVVLFQIHWIKCILSNLLNFHVPKILISNSLHLIDVKDVLPTSGQKFLPYSTAVAAAGSFKENMKNHPC